LTSLLRRSTFALRSVLPVLKQMRAFIHPDLFFPTLRNFLKCGNTAEIGIIFEGPPEEKPILIQLADGGEREVAFNTPLMGLRGPTGAMTSTMAFVDAALGIRTSIDADLSLKETMKDFKRFHPQQHVLEIQSLHDKDSIRKVVLSCDSTIKKSPSSFNALSPCNELIDSYDDAVTAATEFRLGHVDHIATFILQYNEFVPMRSINGTGNTPISAYLCRSAIGTLDAQIRPNERSVPNVALPTLCELQCRLDASSPSISSDVSRLQYCKRLNKIAERMQMQLEVKDLLHN